jgi:hypothetical protein
MLYVIGITVFLATRSLEHFWSGILDPIGFILLDDITRYWTVIEKHAVCHLVAFSRQRRLPLQPPALDQRRAALAGLRLGFFPMSVEALTARSQGRRAAKAKEQELTEAAPVRSLVAARIPVVHQVFGLAPPGRNILRSRACGCAIFCATFPSGASSACSSPSASTTGIFAGRVADQNVWPVTYLMVQAVEGSATFSSSSSPLSMPRSCSGASATRTSTASTTRCPCANPPTGSRLTAIVLRRTVLLAVAMLVGISCRPSRATTTTNSCNTSRSSTSSPSRRSWLYPARALRADRGLEQSLSATAS